MVLARRARWFHRGGKLRFTFQKIDLPPIAAQLQLPEQPPVLTPTSSENGLVFRTQAILKGAEGGQGPVKVDGEGGVQAQESKPRFVETAIAAVIAHRAADNDTGRTSTGSINAQNSNIVGRTLGGGLGLGLLGTVIAQSSPQVGMALGYYGLAWSVFNTIIARGSEVQFGKNAVLDVGFSARPRTPAPK